MPEIKMDETVESVKRPVFRDIRRYICEYCGICMSKKSLINSHINSHHKEEVEKARAEGDNETKCTNSNNTCQECGASFKKRAYLLQHMKSHSLEREKEVEANNRRSDIPSVARDPPSLIHTPPGNSTPKSPSRKRTRATSSLGTSSGPSPAIPAEPITTVIRGPELFLPEGTKIYDLLSSTLCPPSSEERMKQSPILDFKDQTLSFMMDLPGRFNFVMNQMFRLKEELLASETKVKELEERLKNQEAKSIMDEAKLRSELDSVRALCDHLLKDVTKAELEAEEAERKAKLAEEELVLEKGRNKAKLEEITTAWGASTTATVSTVLDQVRLIVGDSYDFSGVSAFKVVKDGVAVDLEEAGEDAEEEIAGDGDGTEVVADAGEVEDDVDPS